jgi:cell wall-associated NlpC family hydrolase
MPSVLPARHLCLVLWFAALAGCAGTPPYRDDRSAASATGVETRSPGAAVAALAEGLIGRPYRYGGADPDSGFDCSGLVFYTYRKSGFNVPRTSQDLFKAARKIALTDARSGDLVFFQDQAKLSHVGIYLGDGLFVHAPETGRTVSIDRLSAPYYQEHLVAVGRLLPN